MWNGSASQPRIFAWTEPTDMRNYAESIDMQSNPATVLSRMPKSALLLRIIRIVSVGLEHCQ